MVNARKQCIVIPIRQIQLEIAGSVAANTMLGELHLNNGTLGSIRDAIGSFINS